MSTATQTQKKEFIALWKNTSKEGKSYFQGKTDHKLALTGFYVTHKKNPKEPDLRIYYHDEQNKLVEYAAMWCNVSKSGNKYLTGALVDDKSVKLTGFISKSGNLKHPYIRIYKTDELNNKEEVKDPVVETPAKEVKKESKKESKVTPDKFEEVYGF